MNGASIDHTVSFRGAREYSWTIDTPKRGYEYGYCDSWEEAAHEIAWRTEAARLGIPTHKPQSGRWDSEQDAP